MSSLLGLCIQELSLHIVMAIRARVFVLAYEREKATKFYIIYLYSAMMQLNLFQLCTALRIHGTT